MRCIYLSAPAIVLHSFCTLLSCVCLRTHSVLFLCVFSLSLISPNFHINDFWHPYFPSHCCHRQHLYFCECRKIKNLFRLLKGNDGNFFQSSIDTRGGVLSLKINIVITFKQGSDFKPGLLCNQNLHASKLL